MQLRLAAVLLFLCASASATVTNVTDAAGLLTAVAACASGDTINMKSGSPYVLTSAMAIPVACGTMFFRGDQTTPGDGGTKPLLTTATDATNLISSTSNSGIHTFDNIAFSNTAAVRANAIVQLAGGLSQHWVFRNSSLDGFTTGINNDNAGAHFYVASTAVTGTEIKNCSASGVTVWGGTLSVYGSWLHSSLVNVKSIGLTTMYVSHSIISAATSGTLGGLDASTNLNVLVVSDSVFANNAGDGLATGTPGNGLFSSVNNIYYGNGLSGRNGPSATVPWESEGDAYQGTSTGTATAAGTTTLTWAGGTVFDVSMVAKTVLYAGVNYTVSAFTDSTHLVMTVAVPAHAASPFTVGGITNGFGSATDLVLTADPFVNAAAGNFALNTTAGGGALLRAAGFPGVFPGALSTGYLDIGAVQSAGAGAFAFAAP